MKTKVLLFVTCLTAGALVASPAHGKPGKKSMSRSHPHRTAVRTTQRAAHTTTHYRSARVSSPRVYTRSNYAGARYNGTRSYAGRQYNASGYYSGSGRQSTNAYYGGGYSNGAPRYYGSTGSYYGGGSYPYYSYYSGWPSSNWGYGTSGGYYPYSYYGGYPYSGYNNYYSYYAPRYGYDVSTVASVQRRLGELGYYHGAVDGVIGPQTRGAIAAFESRNGLVVDATISRSLLFRLGLA